MVREELRDLVCLSNAGNSSRVSSFHDVIHDAYAWSKFQIGDPCRVRVVCDRIQSFSRQEIVHGVERVVKIELRALAQIMKHDAACIERFGLYRLTVQPKFAAIFSSYLNDDHIGVFARRWVSHSGKRHIEFASCRCQRILLNSPDNRSMLIGQPQYLLHSSGEDVSLRHHTHQRCSSNRITGCCAPTAIL